MKKPFKRSKVSWGWEYAVVGYWSAPVRVEKPKKQPWDNEWRLAEVGHSCGGQDGTILSLDAFENFAAALTDAIAFARKLNAKLPAPPPE